MCSASLTGCSIPGALMSVPSE